MNAGFLRSPAAASLRKLAGSARQSAGGELAAGLGVLVLVLIIITPLPPFMLDLALALSFTASLLILLFALSLESALEFSSLPALLLLLTIFRLSLNIATTRLILSHGGDGAAAAGQVIAAVGALLMRGDVLVGAIVFFMILVVNFSVITKGSGRIAEVCARFYLDAMPGKQMAIDADLSSGQINEQTARKRRGDLEAEIAFYGAMDGASKFVRGDAIAAMVLTAVNITIGVGAGMIRTKLSFDNAVSTFMSLTIGDGLVSQIPALLVSLAAGIVVSKGAAGGKVHGQVATQLASNSGLMLITGAAAGMLALLPGFPAVPFLIVSGLAGSAGWMRIKRSRAETVQPPAAPPAPPPPERAPALDLLRIELGYGLLELVGNGTQPLVEQIKGLRRAIAAELGFILPSVRIQDNMELGPYAYSLMLKDIAAGTGELRPTMLMAISATDAPLPLPAEKTIEPAFGLPAYWISPSQADAARAHNCTIAEPGGVLTTHLGEVVRDNITDLMSYTETQKLLSDLPQEQQRLVADIIPAQITAGALHRVLQTLLADRVSIRDMPAILEAVQEACSGNIKAPEAIVTHVRARLARQISDSHTGPDGQIAVIPLSAEWENTLSGALIGSGDDTHIALPRDRLQDFLSRVRAAVEASIKKGDKPVILTGARIRSYVAAIMDRAQIGTPVLAQTEIHRRARIRITGTI